MVEINQFGSLPQGSAQMCGRCEALLMDVLDGAALPADQEFFDQHVASCTGCSQMLADAQRGGAWLEMLRDPRPEPPADLFQRILAQTSGAMAVDVASSEVVNKRSQGSAGRPATPFEGAGVYAFPFQAAGATVRPQGKRVLPFSAPAAWQPGAWPAGAWQRLGHTMLQPRLAMTAAMAFFSIALTLNLTGVHVSAVRMSDLKPANLRRGFFEANAHVVRYCDNLRVVYELEARTHELQRSTESDAQSDAPRAPTEDSRPEGSKGPKNGDPTGEPKSRPKPGPGTSRRGPDALDGRMVASAGTACDKMGCGAAGDKVLDGSSTTYLEGERA